MAIVKMQKISLIGLCEQKEAIIEGLMDLSVVQINSQEQKLSDEQWLEISNPDSMEEATAELELKIAKAASVIDIISKYSETKSPLFPTRIEIEKFEAESILKNKDIIESTIEEVSGLSQSLHALRTKENRLKNLSETLNFWNTYDLPLEYEGTQNASVILGSFPSLANLSSIEDTLLNEAPECHLELIRSDKDQQYVCIIYHRAAEENVFNVIRQYAFSKSTFKDIIGTAASNLDEIQKQLEETELSRNKIIEEIKTYANVSGKIKLYYDNLLIERDNSKIHSHILKTEKAFYLDGWLPKRSASEVENFLIKYDCVVNISDPEKDEDVPILLHNNVFAQPHEAITELYSLPSHKNIDPTSFFAPFYCIFFGMMLSDAGYGIVLFLGCLIVLKKFKLEGFIKKLITTLMFAGISTIFWGAMFGGWFGDIVAVVGKTFFQADIAIDPIWFNPVNDPMTLLIFSFILGGIQMFLGMGLHAYIMIRDGDPLGAIFDVGSWYIVFIGIIIMIFGNMNPGLIVTAVGALMLICTQGRHEKKLIKKIFSGISSLYNITGYLSDLMSYSRLLALGLATGVIASVVNTMGSMAGGGIKGAIILTIVFIVGHIFNMAINSLGTFVHASRLQYVEFFGRFYEGGGIPFTPFIKKTKYHKIVSKK